VCWDLVAAVSSSNNNRSSNNNITDMETFRLSLAEMVEAVVEAVAAAEASSGRLNR